MSRFQREYNGEFGEFWQKKAHEDIERILKNVEVDDDGAARWKNNGGYLMDDVIEKLLVGGADWFDVELTKAKRREQVKKIVANARKSKCEPSDEELYEMKAAFGSGTTVVNVLTGKKIRL